MVWRRVGVSVRLGSKVHAASTHHLSLQLVLNLLLQRIRERDDAKQATERIQATLPCKDAQLAAMHAEVERLQVHRAGCVPCHASVQANFL